MEREYILKIQRALADGHDVIMEGRDIGSEVFPNAELKIFLNAELDERAKRRYKENVEKNIACTFEEVLSNLQERDYRDTHRDISPLIIVPGVYIVDNSEIGIDETIDICYDYIISKLKEGGKV